MSEEFNVGLCFKERLMLDRIFPQKSTLDNQVIVRDLVRRLGVTKKEKETLRFRRTPNGWEWDEDKEVAVIKADFTTKEIKFLNEQLKRLDKEQTITQDMIELCLKIKMLKKED